MSTHTSPINGLTLTTDVLIIGGGPAAAWAALAATRNGAKVVIVDKGRHGSSGALAASTAGPRILPNEKELRDPVKFERYALGGHLANHAWWDRILDLAFEYGPQVYDFGGYDRPPLPKPGKKRGGGAYGVGGLQGPEVMRIMRQQVLKAGVTVLDHSPALELLVAEDGSVAGARGIQRQENREWTVRATSVVLASGGCAWLSKALGCNTNTGDGLLMAVESGAELSGMEFSSHYAPASVHASVTKGAYYRYASFTDEAGNPLPGASKDGHRSTSSIAKGLLKGKVFAQLNLGTADPRVREMLRLGQPNFFAQFDKAGIDPFEQRFEFTLILEGTVRGTGGIRLVTEDCGTTVKGLYAAGDAATRELVCGGFTGGGGPNMTWAIGSGNLAGEGAARYAREHGGEGVHTRPVRATGTAGVRARNGSSATYDAPAVVKAVQDEVFPYDKNIFRSEETLLRSLAILESLWSEVQSQPLQDTPQHTQRSREAASLVAAARWSYFAGLNRKETRGIHKRLDYPKLDPEQRHYLAVGGLDKLWVRPEPVTEAVVPEPATIPEVVAS